MGRDIKHSSIDERPPEFADAGLEIDYGFHASPFGLCLIMIAQGSVLGLAFVENSKKSVFEDMAARWPQASYQEAPRKTISFVHKIFSKEKSTRSAVPLLLIGTDFQRQVWKKLLAIPSGRTTHYGRLAAQLGCPKAARALGRAVGQNPISWLVPCHRVLRRDGGLGGYHWGLAVKKKMLLFEKGQKRSFYKKAA